MSHSGLVDLISDEEGAYWRRLEPGWVIESLDQCTEVSVAV